MTKANLLISTVNGNGVNDIQIAQITRPTKHGKYSPLYLIHKTFTSKVGKAKLYAEKYARKNKISLI